MSASSFDIRLLDPGVRILSVTHAVEAHSDYVESSAGSTVRSSIDNPATRQAFYCDDAYAARKFREFRDADLTVTAREILASRL